MKHFFEFGINLAALFCVIFTTQVQAHGFGASTLIRSNQVSWWSIQQIYDTPSSKKQKILSSDAQTKKCIAATVKAAAESTTNCYVKISFDNNPDITCTPVQEFYMPETKKWVPVYRLHVGDKLLSNCTTLKAITSIEFVKKPHKIFALRIKKNHNYMVGRYNILTHNLTLAIPSLTLSIFTTFGEGAVAGGTVGSWLGPVGIGLGATIVGAIAVGGWLIFGNDHKRSTFDAHFNADAFGDYFNAQAKSDEKGEESDEKPKGNTPPKDGSGKIWDTPPKKGEVKKGWVKLPGAQGWKDEEGRIWTDGNKAKNKKPGA